MEKIIIFDTTLRDGEQSPGASLTTPEKLIIAKQLAKLGVDVIEAGFPISSDGDFEAVKLIAKEVKGPIICGLSRAKKQDIDRTWDAIKFADKPRIHTFFGTSDLHLKHQFKKTKQETIDLSVEAVRYAKSLCQDIEYSAMDASRTDPEFLYELIKRVIEAGANTINIPDTVGYAEPEEFGAIIKKVFEKLGHLIEKNNVVISVHCHNDLGLAVANSLEAVKNGATQIECTINGLGERAGNCSLEEIAMNIKTRKDFFRGYSTNIDTKEILHTSQLVSNLTGMGVQRNKAIVGKNAFAHESGIHQHGLLNEKSTYEIMNPKDIGWSGTNFVIGKHSGKHAVEVVLKDMGYDFKKEQVDKVITKVKELADKQKEIMPEDIIAIATDVAGELSKEEEIIILDEVKVTAGNKIKPEATVTLIVDGKKKTGTGKGVGPVDAVSHAIRTMIDPSIKLKEYGLKAITGGTDALADVSIKVQDSKSNVFKAEAVNEDIIMASAIALIKGMNKALNFQRNKQNKKIHAQY
jgi:2-isopropylmalate synthase